jgi:hypothetical protein
MHVAATTIDAVATGAGIGRRTFFRYFSTVFAGLHVASFGSPSVKTQHHDKDTVNTTELLDHVAIVEVIMRERLARETHDSVGEATCFHPDSTVEVSWFKGTGAEFIAAGNHNPGTPHDPAAAIVNLDSMSPAVVTIKNGRATANTSCALRAFSRLDCVDISITSYARLLWRVQRLDGKWLIAGLRGIYIRDLMVPCNPNHVPKLDEEKLATFRPSYRYLSYLHAAQGLVPFDDLPGVDRPETVNTLYAAERKWLEQN